jgi:hypothetical protein
MVQPTSKEIISAGFIEVKVKSGGFIKKHRLTVVRENTGFGEIPFLFSKESFPNAEMVRLANELQLPIKSGSAVAFPTGKMAKDFSGF